MAVRKDKTSNTTDNIIHVGKGYGQCKVDDSTGTTGSVEYLYETSAMGDARLERYWDKVDVEIIPDIQGGLTPSYTVNVHLDSFNSSRAAISYGSEVALTYIPVTGVSDETYVSSPSLIETADVNQKDEFGRLRLNMTWHDSSDASSKVPPRISGVRFRTRITGMDRTNP